MYISRRCGELVAHIQNTNTQYNLPAFKKKLSRKYNHDGVAERFEDPAVRKSVEVDLAIIDSLNQILKKLEWHIEKAARQHDYHNRAQADYFDCAGIRVPKYILKLPNGGTLIVKEQFWRFS